MANLLTNPGAEVDTAGWTAGNATLTRVTTPVRTGVGAFRLSSTAAGNVDQYATDLTGLTPGASVTFSVYGRGATVGREIIMLVDWKTSAGAYLSTSSTSTAGTFTTNTTGWVLASHTVVIPATATRAGIYARIVGTAAAAELHYFDDFVFDTASTAAANAGADASGAPGTVATLIGTPPGGTWSQDSGDVVTLSAPVTNATDTRVTFTRANAGSTAIQRVFRYTVA